jgi:hypothetical protein
MIAESSSLRDAATTRFAQQQNFPRINRLSVTPNAPTVSHVKALLVTLGLAMLAGHASAVTALPHESGAVYLEDLAIKPVRLTVVGEAPVYSQITSGRYLGILRRGTTADVVAIADGLLRVRGTAQQGGVVGWVPATGLTPLKQDFIDSVRKNAARKADVDALIAKGEVALNMTHEEVTSALGKPQKKTSKLDAKGRQDIWEFIRYARVPQETTGFDPAGRIVTTTIYVKVPAGKLAVSFENNLVSALEQSEGTTDVPGPIRLVPAPVVMVY